MPKGQCKLCLAEGVELRDSHLVPRALYRMSHDPRAQGAAARPYTLTRRGVSRNARQLKDYVLCHNCEERFNDNGEAYVSRLMNSRVNLFPLLNRLNVAYPHESSALAGYDAYSGSAVGIDTEKIAYFCLSVMWRSSVHRWQIHDKQTTSIDLGAYQEPIRTYLLGKTPYPQDVVVHATACKDRASQGTFWPPANVPENKSAWRVYSLLTRGIYFRMLVGADISEDVRKLCCYSGFHKFLFTADCSRQTEHAFREMAIAAGIIGP